MADYIGKRLGGISWTGWRDMSIVMARPWFETSAGLSNGSRRTPSNVAACQRSPAPWVQFRNNT